MIYRFLDSDLPNMASHCPQKDCGFSVYRNVLIQWDEDFDKRILGVLDAMQANHVDQLIAAQEHEGGIAFLWKGRVPARYSEGNELEPPDGDLWVIVESKSISSSK